MAFYCVREDMTGLCSRSWNSVDANCRAYTLDGRFYERLVGITKWVLRKILGFGVSCPTLSQLTTILAEVQVIVNSRPLVYVGDDINSSHVLVPNDFLSINSNNDIYDHCPEEKDKNYLPNVTISIMQRRYILKVWKRN